MPRSKEKFLAVLALLVAMLSIQSGVSIAKRLFPIVGPAGTAALRITLAALLLSLVFHPWKVLTKTKLSREQTMRVLAYGICLGVMNFTFYLAVERIPLGLAVAIEFLGPLTLAVLTSKKALDLIWVALAALGILLILPIQNNVHSLDPIGVVLALIAGALWGLYIYFGHKLGSALPGGIAATLGMIVGAAVVLPVGATLAKQSIFQLSLLPLALVVALVSSAIPYSLEMFTLRRLTPQNFSILMSLEPAVAALAGLLLMEERLTLTQWVAIGCVILASLGSSLSTRKNLS